MVTMTQEEQRRLSLAVRTVWDVLRHLDMSRADAMDLETAAYDLLDLLHAAEHDCGGRQYIPGGHGLPYRAALAQMLVKDGTAPGTVAVYAVRGGGYLCMTPTEAVLWGDDVRQVVAPFDDDSACAFRGEQRLTPEQAMDWAAWIVAQEGPPAPWR